MTVQCEAKEFDVTNIKNTKPNLEELVLHKIGKNDLGKLSHLNELPVKSLELRWYGGSDLTSISFTKSLKRLKVWHSSKFKSLEGIQGAENLKVLELEDNGQLEGLSPLASLQQLNELSIIGGYGSEQKVQSFLGVEDLPLERVTLRGIKGSDLDLSPVANLKNLVMLDVHGLSFDPLELAKLAAAYPWFLEQLLNLKDYTFPGMNCKKCGSVQKEMFLKRKKFLWCASCNQAGIDKVLAEFKNLVEAARIASQ